MLGIAEKSRVIKCKLESVVVAETDNFLDTKCNWSHESFPAWNIEVAATCEWQIGFELLMVLYTKGGKYWMLLLICW